MKNSQHMASRSEQASHGELNTEATPLHVESKCKTM